MKLSHEILLKEYLSNTLELDILDLDSCSLRFYYNFIKKNLKIPGDILELGVYRGKSLLTAALILKILGSKKNYLEQVIHFQKNVLYHSNKLQH